MIPVSLSVVGLKNMLVSAICLLLITNSPRATHPSRASDPQRISVRFGKSMGEKNDA